MLVVGDNCSTSAIVPSIADHGKSKSVAMLNVALNVHLFCTLLFK